MEQPPAIVGEIRGAAEGRRKGRAGGEVQRILERLEHRRVAGGGVSEEDDPGRARSAAGEQAAEGGHRLVAVRQGSAEAAGLEGPVDDQRERPPSIGTSVYHRHRGP